MSQTLTENAVCGTLGCLILFGYHVYYAYLTRYHPNHTVTGWTQRARRAWVKETLSKKSGDILAVQTLRNWILASTFLATVAITIGFGLMQFLTAAYNASKYDLMAPPGSIPRDNVLTGLITDPLVGVKTVIILFFSLVAFFCFTQSIRYFNHVGFCLNIPMMTDKVETGIVGSDGIEEEGEFRESPEHLADMLNAGNFFFTVGLRCYYLSFPFMFWYFGPFFFLASCVLVVFAVSMTDRSTARLRFIPTKSFPSTL